MSGFLTRQPDQPIASHASLVPVTFGRGYLSGWPMRIAVRTIECSLARSWSATPAISCCARLAAGQAALSAPACWWWAPAGWARRCCSIWRRQVSVRSASSTTTRSRCPSPAPGHPPHRRRRAAEGRERRRGDRPAQPARGIETHPARLTADNAIDLARRYDLAPTAPTILPRAISCPMPVSSPSGRW